MLKGCEGCRRRRELMKKKARQAWDAANKRFGRDWPYPKWMVESTAR